MEKLEKWKANWMNMTIQKQFETAVNIIKSLPKDGPYQPSNNMMLKFYGYYKQATLGPCDDPKPSFWDVVKRAKWEAWHKLGNMSPEEAMRNYVDDLKQIIETMSFSNEVAEFMDSLGPFYETIDDTTDSLNESNHGDSGIELEQGNVNALLGNFDDAFEDGTKDVQSRAKLLESRVDKMFSEIDKVQKLMSTSVGSQDNQTSEDEDHFEDPAGDFDIDTPKTFQRVEIDKALNDAVTQLNCDVDHMKARLTTLENLVTSMRPAHDNKSFLSELNPSTTAFVVVWPFIAFAILKMCQK